MKSESLIEDDLRPSSGLDDPANQASQTSFRPGNESVMAMAVEADAAVRKYVPRPIITQFTDDPQEIMKGMRTPFITNMNDQYNDPDVQPVPFSALGLGNPDPAMNRTTTKIGGNFPTTGPR